jgi:hypothetical protein
MFGVLAGAILRLMHQMHPSHYFERRAEEERAAAQRATNERAAQSHRELADRYHDLATGAEQPLSEDGAGDAGILWKDFRIVP